MTFTANPAVNRTIKTEAFSAGGRTSGRVTGWLVGSKRPVRVCERVFERPFLPAAVGLLFLSLPSESLALEKSTKITDPSPIVERSAHTV